MSRLWILDLDDTVAYTTRDMQDDPRRFASLTLVDGVREFLEQTKARGDRCVLISVGVWALQERKIHTLGLVIDHKILPDNGTSSIKEGTFKEYAAMADGDVVVVGDRLDRDITPAKSLGFTTVRICLPEGKYSHHMPQSDEEIPDHTVKDFFELMRLPIF
jgi:FMN phosphatase YigB (HAD superfamily)